jgi:hypothetical protein
MNELPEVQNKTMTARQLTGMVSLNPRPVTAFELVEMNKMQKHLICLRRLSITTVSDKMLLFLILVHFFAVFDRDVSR